MNLAELDDPHPGTPPLDLSPALRALWHARHGGWAEAHAIVQSESDADSAWVHAHLHRVEGDRDNAAYWYRRAGRPEARGDLDGEWRAIAVELLGRHRP